MINLTIVVLSLTGRWRFAVLGCQLHQQSRREWDGLEPRLTIRDEWAVASLALGLFSRADPGLRFQLINSDWLVPCQSKEILFLLILESDIIRKRKRDDKSH